MARFSRYCWHTMCASLDMSYPFILLSCCILTFYAPFYAAVQENKSQVVRSHFLMTHALQDSSTLIKVSIKELKGFCTVRLYNPEGKMIAQDVVKAIRHQVTLDRKGLKTGVYTVEVLNEGKSYWQKVDVKKD